MLDLTKAFELVPHDVLINAAIRYRYSLWLLRLSLASYRLTRQVGSARVWGAPVRATRCITAGSGFACIELLLLLMRNLG